MIPLNKRGTKIGLIGAALIVISFSIMLSVLPDTDIFSQEEVYLPRLFDGMFNQVYEDIQILPGSSEYISYSSRSSNVPILWGIQIIDYKTGDKISVKISNMFGDVYGEYDEDGPLLFETLDLVKSDILNFEIYNPGSNIIKIAVMIAEDPNSSGEFSNIDSPLMNTILPLAISGIMLVFGIVVFLFGIILYIVDWKNIQNKKSF